MPDERLTNEQIEAARISLLDVLTVNDNADGLYCSACDCGSHDRMVAIEHSPDCPITVFTALLHERRQAAELGAALHPQHKCRCLAVIHNMSEGRDWWLGELIERVPEWPHETHCLHIKTPLKDVVFLCNVGDMQGLTVLCDIPFPIKNPTWKERMEAAYRRAGEARQAAADLAAIHAPPAGTAGGGE